MSKNNSPSSEINSNKNKTLNLLPFLIITYSICVISADLLITFDVHLFFSWGIFNFNLSELLLKIPVIRNHPIISIFENFDLYKFIFWLILPFILFNKFIDFKWLSFKYWQRHDYFIFFLFCTLSLSSLTFVILSPTLRMYYPGIGMVPYKQKIFFFFQQFLWIVSWLPGWEFLNRHLLLRACRQISKGYGWLLVPIIETLYHIYKAMLEILGMFIFSTVACIWSLKRENNLMAIMCHFIIEVGLIFLLLFT